MKEMKIAIRIFAVGFAASLALVSCAKQEAVDNGSVNPAGVARTIAVSFANGSTKSALEDLQPKFVAGDVIKVSNGAAAENCPVDIDGSGNASITTSLTGELTVVYPYTAAKMNSENPNKIDGVLVPTVQDGTFASANICMTTIVEGATEAQLANQTAVFCITPGAGARTKYVELITAGAEIANSVPEGSEYDTMHKIHVASASAASVYVSILVPTGLKFRDLSFADGNNMKTLMDDPDAIAVNSLYTVDKNNWSRPYVDLQMKVGGKIRTYKWATMNIGATKPEDYGEYFAWGETTGHSLIEDWKNKWSDEYLAYTDVFNPDNYSFDWSNAPFNNGQSDYDEAYFNAHKSEWLTGEDILKLEYDAANVNWGGSWRMPTNAEFGALKAIAEEWDAEKRGWTFGDSSAQIFLPAAGYGYGADMSEARNFGDYLSSSLNTDYPKNAYVLDFYSIYVTTSYYYRFIGQSVRPFSE